MTEIKHPTDHKKKAGSENYTFEYDGKTYTFEKSLDLVDTPKWARANRRRDQVDLFFTLIEEVAGDECLEAIDKMTPKEFEKFSEDFGKARSAEQG